MNNRPFAALTADPGNLVRVRSNPNPPFATMTDRLRFATYWALLPWAGFSALEIYNHSPLKRYDILWMIFFYPFCVFLGRYVYDAWMHDRKKAAEKAKAREYDA